MGKALILVVEDDPVVMKVVTAKLQAEGHEVMGVESCTAAIQAAQTVRPDLMILDLRLVQDYPFNAIHDGFGVLGWLRRRFEDDNFPVIIHTIDDSPGTLEGARANGAYAVFKKGDDLNELMATVHHALTDTKAA